MENLGTYDENKYLNPKVSWRYAYLRWLSDSRPRRRCTCEIARLREWENGPRMMSKDFVGINWHELVFNSVTSITLDSFQRSARKLQSETKQRIK